MHSTKFSLTYTWAACKRHLKIHFRPKKAAVLSSIWIVFFSLIKCCSGLPRVFSNTLLKTLCFMSTFIFQAILGQSKERPFLRTAVAVVVPQNLRHDKWIAQEIKLHISICKKPLLKFNWVGLQAKMAFISIMLFSGYCKELGVSPENTQTTLINRKQKQFSLQETLPIYITSLDLWCRFYKLLCLSKRCLLFRLWSLYECRPITLNREAIKTSVALTQNWYIM